MGGDGVGGDRSDGVTLDRQPTLGSELLLRAAARSERLHLVELCRRPPTAERTPKASRAARTPESGTPPRERGRVGDVTIIKINAITVAADSGDELAKRFAKRAGAVDDQDGFEGFELLQPTDDRTTWLVVARGRTTRTPSTRG